MPEPGIIALRVRPQDPQATRDLLAQPDVTLLVSGQPVADAESLRTRIDLIVEMGLEFTITAPAAKFSELLRAVALIGKFKLLGGCWDFPLLATARVLQFIDEHTLRELRIHGVHFDTHHPQGFRPLELVA